MLLLLPEPETPSVGKNQNTRQIQNIRWKQIIINIQLVFPNKLKRNISLFQLFCTQKAKNLILH